MNVSQRDIEEFASSQVAGKSDTLKDLATSGVKKKGKSKKREKQVARELALLINITLLVLVNMI